MVSYRLPTALAKGPENYTLLLTCQVNGLTSGIRARHIASVTGSYDWLYRSEKCDGQGQKSRGDHSESRKSRG
jgi:hypothetical protein